METIIYLKILLGILAFLLLEVFYAYASELDTERQLEEGATLDPDGMDTAKLVAKRKDYIGRGVALSYVLVTSSVFRYFRCDVSSGYRTLSIIGAIFGSVLIFLIFIFRDYIKASRFDKNSYFGKFSLFAVRIVAYGFTLLFLL